MEEGWEYMANAITHIFGDFTVTPGKLKNLTKDFTIEFLIRCMNHVNQRIIRIAANDEEKEVKQLFPEDHWDVIKFINTLARDNVIGVMDIFEPKSSKKMKFVIKFLINYILYLESNSDAFKEVVSAHEDLIQKFESLKVDIKTNKQEMIQRIQDVEKMRDIQESRERVLAEVNAEYDSIQISRHYKDKVETLKNNIQMLKEELENHQEKFKKTKLLLKERTSTLEWITQYSKLNVEHQELEKQCQEAQQTDINLKNLHENKMDNITCFETLLKEVQAYNDYIQTNKLAERSLKYKSLKDSIARDESGKLMKIIEELEGSIQSTKENTAKLMEENDKQHLKCESERRIVEESKKKLECQVKETTEENEMIVAKNYINIVAFKNVVKICKTIEARIQSDNEEDVQEYRRLQLEFKEKIDFIINTLRGMQN